MHFCCHAMMIETLLLYIIAAPETVEPTVNDLMEVKRIASMPGV